MKFAIQHYANISTVYITESDLNLVSCVDAPNHMAEHDTGRASFFYSPTADKAVSQRFVAEARSFGFSERFIAIMLELSRQRIPCVRFDTDGGQIEDLEPVRSWKTAPEVIVLYDSTAFITEGPCLQVHLCLNHHIIDLRPSSGSLK